MINTIVPMPYVDDVEAACESLQISSPASMPSVKIPDRRPGYGEWLDRRGGQIGRLVRDDMNPHASLDEPRNDALEVNGLRVREDADFHQRLSARSV